MIGILENWEKNKSSRLRTGENLLMKYDFQVDISAETASSLILRRISPGTRVLEFGPATGYMTKFMKEELGCTICCIEIDRNYVEIVKKYADNVIQADLDKLEWLDKLNGQTFDHLIFADVLEHLYDPIKVLKQSIKLLSKTGSLIISVPNIAHNAILMGLIEGNFDYKSMGLLDETHIRFFTKKSLLAMLDKVEVQPIEWLGTIANPEDTEFKKSYTSFPNPIQRILKSREDGHVYQYVSVSKRKESLSLKEKSINFKETSIAHNEDLLKIFWKKDGQYNEHNNLKLPLELENGFCEYTFKLPIEASGILRIDPCEFPAYIEISCVSIFHPDLDKGLDPILVCNGENNFEPLLPSQNIVCLEGENTLRILSLDNDPQLFLDIKGLTAESKMLKIVMKVSENIFENIPLQMNKVQDKTIQEEVKLFFHNNKLPLLKKTITKQKNREKELYINKLKEENKKLEICYAQLAEMKKIANNYKSELDNIFNSDGWKFLLRYYKLRDKLLPESTWRRKIIRNFWNCKQIHKYFLKAVNCIKLYGFVTFVRKVRNKIYENKRINEPNSSVKVPQIKLVDVENKEIKNYDVTISVVIPTKNAGKEFRMLLQMLTNQRGFKKIEIIMVDSGSTDDTLLIAQEYGVKTTTIKPEEFSHSYSRNLGAEISTGEYLLFTTQDALPPSDTWLYEMFSAMQNNDVVAVSCAETPREDADLFYRVICWNHYKFLEVDKMDRIFYKPEVENYITLRKNGQLSDIANLISRSVFLDYKYRFNYAEDLDLGIRLIKDSYKLAFLGSVRIIHSHNRPAYYFLKRGYVDNLFLEKLFKDFPVPHINAESITKDILFSFNILTEIINEITTLQENCSVNSLIVLVTQKLDDALKQYYSQKIQIIDNNYIDNNFKNLMIRFSKEYNGSDEKYNGIVINAIKDFIGITFEYIKECNDVLDENSIEEFKLCMMKEFAIVCGSHLAYCYLKGSVSEKERLKEIHCELTKGV